MGYSARGHKVSDTPERLTLTPLSWSSGSQNWSLTFLRSSQSHCPHWTSFQAQASFGSMSTLMAAKFSHSLCMHAKPLQSHLTLWDPMDCSLPGSSVHRILQARILEWVVMPSSRDLPNKGIEPKFLISLALAGGFFTTSATWEALLLV